MRRDPHTPETPVKWDEPMLPEQPQRPSPQRPVPPPTEEDVDDLPSRGGSFEKR